ncbi:hypothetical protein BJ508DRAFT_306016 [Ascobolus immersus RN42]|uniref:Uncharacterized protein n=1 Tax=Ascobolus immersus RN42 TaxID=1160509 RepID=A0A3N4IDA4_ASCIM|nr:hypothetical protein BJ508DRAFT_306016 [Ascobolus immersus RN42]
MPYNFESHLRQVRLKVGRHPGTHLFVEWASSATDEITQEGTITRAARYRTGYNFRKSYDSSQVASMRPFEWHRCITERSLSKLGFPIQCELYLPRNTHVIPNELSGTIHLTGPSTRQFLAKGMDERYRLGPQQSGKNYFDEQTDKMNGSHQTDQLGGRHMTKHQDKLFRHTYRPTLLTGLSAI